MQKELSFDLALKEVTVTLSGKKCKLRELTGNQRDAHIEKVRSFVKMEYVEEEQRFKVKEMLTQKGINNELVQMSLVDENGKSYDLSVIETWPARVTDILAKEIRELSGLSEDDEAKKEALVKKG